MIKKRTYNQRINSWHHSYGLCSPIEIHRLRPVPIQLNVCIGKLFYYPMQCHMCLAIYLHCNRLHLNRLV